jgi:hypothetical protein
MRRILPSIVGAREQGLITTSPTALGEEIALLVCESAKRAVGIGDLMPRQNLL